MRPVLLLSLATILTACAASATNPSQPSESVGATATQPPTAPEPSATLTGAVFDAICVNNKLAALTGSALGETHLSDDTQVTVNDGSNNTLGVGRLKVDPGINHDCNYTFTVADLPVVPFYSVGVGSYPPLAFTQSEIEAKGWFLELALDYKGDFGNLGSS